MEDDVEPSESIWTSSGAGQAIQDLNQVDQEIGHLLSLAATSISLLSLPQTDGPEDGSQDLPKGDERSEQFVLEVSNYFQTLDAIQEKVREAIARVRQYRITPSIIDASMPGAVPPTFGVGLPSSDEGDGKEKQRKNDRGLQETKIERDAWKKMYELLQKLQDERDNKVQE